MEKLVVNTTPVIKFTYCQIPNHGFHFSFLNDDLQVLFSPTPCKDYFNDILFAEFTGKKVSVYGLTWNKGTYDATKKRFRIIVFGGGVNMETRAQGMQDFINKWDEAQGFSPTVVFTTDNPENIVFDFDSGWASSSPMISAFTTLIRVSGMYTEGDPLDYMRSMYKMSISKDIKYPDYMHVEVRRLEGNFKKLAALLAGKKDNSRWDDVDGTNFYEVHNYGIGYCTTFPTVEVSLN